MNTEKELAIDTKNNSPHIRRLSQVVINQIAAGEVIERPASVIKELLENSIDAKAKKIEVSVVDGGKSFISIKDDGCGIASTELPLAFERHATSKLADEDLFNINTFGFRGEALASISSIARVTIQSKFENESIAYAIMSDENGISEIMPSSLAVGTYIEVADLFYATPARLKFLKTTNTEADACYSAFINIAICRPEIEFKYIEDGKLKTHYKIAESLQERVNDVFGAEFAENTRYVERASDSVSVKAFLGVPNYNKSTSAYQRFFVNGRFIKDKLLSSIVRSAYKEVIPAGRFPACTFFMEIENSLIDINAHPAKTEIRFRDFDLVKGFIYSTVKKTISEGIGQNASSALARMGLENLSKKASLEQFVSDNSVKNISFSTPFVASVEKKIAPINESFYADGAFRENKNFFSPAPETKPRESIFSDSEKFFRKEDLFGETTSSGNIVEDSADSSPISSIDLGKSFIQIGEKYILSENKNNELIIVDQHAVCERITLEKLLKRKSLDSQRLLLPEIIVLQKSQVELLIKNTDIINSFGIMFEKLSFDTVSLVGIPTIFSVSDYKKFITDIVDELEETGTIDSFEEKIRLIFSTISCHNSIRAGKILNTTEMDSILRQAEKTENIAQCCHGRPSYIILKENELDALFER